MMKGSTHQTKIALHGSGCPVTNILAPNAPITYIISVPVNMAITVSNEKYFVIFEYSSRDNIHNINPMLSTLTNSLMAGDIVNKNGIIPALNKKS